MTSDEEPGVNVTINNGMGQQERLMSGAMDANIRGGNLGNTLNANLIIIPFNSNVQYTYRVSQRYTYTVEKWKLKWVTRYD